MRDFMNVLNLYRYRDNLASLNLYPNINAKNTENLDTTGNISFKDIISEEMQKVNNRQIEADNLTQGFITGEVDDLADVLIATDEARLSLELAIQVRNRCIEAFKEINNIQL